MTNDTEKIAQLKATISILEAQRSILGDTAVDLSLQAIRQQIAELEAVSSDVSSLEGERRQATILFSDLSGYTAMNEKLDPEVVQELMGRIKTEAIRIVEHHGGIVNQFVGDEVLALFGIPNAHEDDPVRAVKAALELHDIVQEMSSEVQDLIGRPLIMHSGINTGLVVSTVWDERDGKFTLTGDTVNTGARLVAQAKGDEILVSPQTQMLIAPFFRTESLEPVQMKGKAAPMVPHRVLGKTKVQTRLEAAEQRGFTPYIGREKELATLHASLEKTMQGKGQLVTVRGVAGLGKSRLVHEFRHQIDREKVNILQGRCQSFGTLIPYLPFQDCLRRGLQLTDDDSPEELHHKVVRHVLDIDRSLEKHLPVYLHLLSIPSREYPLPSSIASTQLKINIQEAIIAINTLNTRRKPIVLILEDWHWADEGSDIALGRLLDAISGFPLMIVLLYRPEYTPGWGNLPFHQHIGLQSVPPQSVGGMIKAIYDIETIPESFALEVSKRSGGNPFFIEELCSLLKQNGTITLREGTLQLEQTLEKIRFPQTVQAVVRAKLDRLNVESREVMRLASVIGREFLQKILAQITRQKGKLPDVLFYLQQIEFIQQIRNLPELTYQFNHVITQEVAYQTILLKQRPLLHQLVAETIEVLYKDRLEEQWESLAHHYNRSELWEKAIHYLELSGDKAIQNSSLADARTYYRQALGIIDSQIQKTVDPEVNLKLRWIDVSLKWAGISYYSVSAEATKILEASVSYSKDFEDDIRLARLLHSLGQRNILQGDLEKAEAYFSACQSIAKRVKDLALLGLAFAALGRTKYFDGKYDEAKAYLELGIPYLEEFGMQDKLAYSLCFLGGVKLALGEVDAAQLYIDRAFRIANDMGDLSRLNQCYQWQVTINIARGQWDESIINTRKVASLSRSLGNLMPQASCQNMLGLSLVMKGEKEEGLKHIEESLHLIEKYEVKIFYSPVYAFSAYTFAQLGDYERARKLAQKGIKWGATFRKVASMPYYALAMCEANIYPSDPKLVLTFR